MREVKTVEKREAVVRKMAFSLMTIVQIALFVVTSVAMGAPLILSRLERYPDQFVGDGLKSAILSVCNNFIYGILFSIVIIAVLVFEVLRKEAIAPGIAAAMAAVAVVNCVNAFLGYLYIPFVPCLVIAIASDVAFAALGAVWAVALVRRIKSGKSKKAAAAKDVSAQAEE